MGSRFKSKKKTEYGWAQKEVVNLQRHQNKFDIRLNMLLEITCQMKELLYYLLHEEFGYGQKRISRVDRVLEGALSLYYNKEDGFTPENIALYASESIGIKPSEIAKKVPMAYKQQIAYKQLPKWLKHDTRENMRIITDCIELFMTFAILALEGRHKDSKGKYVRELSANKIKLIVDKYVWYTDILTKPKKYGLTMDDIRAELKNNLDINVTRHDRMKDDYLDNVI